MVDNRHGRVHKRVETLLDRLHVVVRSATRLSTLQKTLLHHVLRTVEKQYKLASAHLLLELLGLVQSTREAVNQKLGALRRRDRLFQKRNRHARRHELAFLHDRLELLALIGSTRNLRAKQVARREVAEAVLGHELLALRALAAARTAKHEHDLCIRGHGQLRRLRCHGY